MSFRYIIRGQGMKAMPVNSDLSLEEMKDLIRSQSNYLHKDSTDTIWTWGTQDFINPKVMMVDDYMNFLPALIGIK